MTRKDDKGDQPSGGETTMTNTGATRSGRGQHKTGSFGDGILRPSPNHGTLRLLNDGDDLSHSGHGYVSSLAMTVPLYQDAAATVSMTAKTLFGIDMNV